MSRKFMTTAILSAAIAGGGLVGALVGGPALSSAQETNQATASAPAAAQPAVLPQTQAQDQTQQNQTQPPDPNAQGAQTPQGRHPQGGQKGPHQANGKTEEVLTGDAATKVTDAAKAKLPDATIDRVETDVDGDTYEAHVTKADGTKATVKLDANFNVTSVQDGMR